MNTYRVTIKGRGSKQIQGTTPMQAFKEIFPDVELIPTKNKNIATVCIELLYGQRKTVSYYTAKTQPIIYRANDCSVKTRNRTVWVTTTEDSGDNEGGYFCQIYGDSEWTEELDTFCIHPTDCNCQDSDEVDKYIYEYVYNMY